MKTITYRYFRQEFNYLQERVDALCAGLDFHVQVCEINHPMDPIRLGGSLVGHWCGSCRPGCRLRRCHLEGR